MKDESHSDMEGHLAMMRNIRKRIAFFQPDLMFIPTEQDKREIAEAIAASTERRLAAPG